MLKAKIKFICFKIHNLIMNLIYNDKFIVSYTLALKYGYADSDRYPLECPYCGCKEFECVNKDYLDDRNIIMSYDIQCKNCKTINCFYDAGYNQHILI